MVPNCVANGRVAANAYVGARVGMGYIDVQSSGSVSTRYCTRNVINSSGSILTIIIVALTHTHTHKSQVIFRWISSVPLLWLFLVSPFNILLMNNEFPDLSINN